MACETCAKKDKSCSKFAAMAVESTQQHIEDMRVLFMMKQILIECRPYIEAAEETKRQRGFIDGLIKEAKR